MNQSGLSHPMHLPRGPGEEILPMTDVALPRNRYGLVRLMTTDSFDPSRPRRTMLTIPTWVDHRLMTALHFPSLQKAQRTSKRLVAQNHSGDPMRRGDHRDYSAFPILLGGHPTPLDDQSPLKTDETADHSVQRLPRKNRGATMNLCDQPLAKCRRTRPCGLPRRQPSSLDGLFPPSVVRSASLPSGNEEA